jgi:hypothetical protein
VYSDTAYAGCTAKVSAVRCKTPFYLVRHPYFEVRVSEFLSSTASREVFRALLGHETDPRSSSEPMKPTEIDCGANPMRLEGLGAAARIRTIAFFRHRMRVSFLTCVFLTEALWVWRGVVTSGGDPIEGERLSLPPINLGMYACDASGSGWEVFV